MAQIQEVTPDTADNYRLIFDVEPLQKVQNNDDNYNVFANNKEHPEKPESVNVTYLKEHGDTNITTDSETQQVIACDEKWVPSTERVKISPTNVRLETTVLQKEETFQVIIDVIKNSTWFKAFTISAEVLKIFMQQFWYTIKNIQGIESYKFVLANKRCVVDAEVFRKILDICPRVEGEEFTKVQDDDATLTFLIDLGYKGPLHKYPSMYMDHMHQPWRTLAAIINKCLFEKTASNDRLRKFKIDIL
ncbi:hypothetical protein Tco_0954438 [Tanacetum coccineum]|uniref:BTB domain-containing protein n=1 Tax=Tanacetum coccineum TaxID=301880 RepID=A0ABQ5E3Q9_9ASTR